MHLRHEPPARGATRRPNRPLRYQMRVTVILPPFFLSLSLSRVLYLPEAWFEYSRGRSVWFVGAAFPFFFFSFLYNGLFKLRRDAAPHFHARGFLTEISG